MALGNTWTDRTSPGSRLDHKLGEWRIPSPVAKHSHDSVP